MSYLDLGRALMPEIIVVLAGFLVLLLDMGLMRLRPLAVRMRVAGIATVIGCVVAIVWLSRTGTPVVEAYDGALRIDPLSQLMKQGLLLLTIVAALISLPGRFTTHVGEYFLLLLLATVGMMFLVGTENLLVVFVALELLSLSLYILTAFNKENIRSAEAALKYFLFGGMSAAFLLFGLSFVYGLSGQLRLSSIATALGTAAPSPLLIAALLLVVVGFGFKVAAVPFHLWAPDAYEGAPLPSAAFIASGSKVASFFVLGKVLLVGFTGHAGSGAVGRGITGWIAILAVVAGLSVVVGNLAAIAQRTVRRLLAYSAVAHAGYALIGLMANGEQGYASLLYYVITYGITALGAFAVVGVVEERSGNDGFGAFAGLGRRSPLIAFSLMIFMLSLAGIPPLAGFFGKFYLFTAALNGSDMGLLWLVILAIAMSAVSLYYYLQVLKQVYVMPPDPATAQMDVAWSSRIVIPLLAFAVLLLGCLPDLLLGRLISAIAAAL